MLLLDSLLKFVRSAKVARTPGDQHDSLATLLLQRGTKFDEMELGTLTPSVLEQSTRWVVERSEPRLLVSSFWPSQTPYSFCPWARSLTTEMLSTVLQLPPDQVQQAFKVHGLWAVVLLLWRVVKDKLLSKKVAGRQGQTTVCK